MVAMIQLAIRVSKPNPFTQPTVFSFGALK